VVNHWRSHINHHQNHNNDNHCASNVRQASMMKTRPLLLLLLIMTVFFNYCCTQDDKDADDQGKKPLPPNEEINENDEDSDGDIPILPPNERPKKQRDYPAIPALATNPTRISKQINPTVKVSDGSTAATPPVNESPAPPVKGSSTTRTPVNGSSAPPVKGSSATPPVNGSPTTRTTVNGSPATPVNGSSTVSTTTTEGPPGGNACWSYQGTDKPSMRHYLIPGVAGFGIVVGT
jgi:hypothetical protein